MTLQPASQASDHPATDAAVWANQVAFYRFYLLRADDHIARRCEDYAADDAAAIACAKQVIGDYAGVEIWCGPRNVATLSREAVAQLQPPAAAPSNHRAALLISRNKRLLQQAAATCRRTAALHGWPTRGRRLGWARLTWQHHDTPGT